MFDRFSFPVLLSEEAEGRLPSSVYYNITINTKNAKEKGAGFINIGILTY